MAEVLGIIGSAITLAGVVLELTAFIKNLSAKVSDAPKTIQRQLVQVEQLVDIANLIERNPQLQTPLVSSILANCVHDAEALRALLTKLISPSTLRGYWKALPGITIKENRILALLKRLEEGKASLALCIASIDSKILNSINLEIGSISQEVGSIAKELPAIKDTRSGVTTILNELPGISDSVTNIEDGVNALSGQVTTTYGKVNDIAEDVHFIRDQFPALTRALERLNLQQYSGAETKDILNITEIAEYNEKRTACLSSLAIVDQSVTLSRIIKSSESSCRWIFKNQCFRSWLDQESSQLLYINAGPGCGKTTTSAHIVRHLMEKQLKIPSGSDQIPSQITEDPKNIVLYFLFQRANVEAEGTATAALRSIIAQFIQQTPTAFPYLLWKYEYLATKGNVIWSWDLLWRIFKEMFGHLRIGLSVFIVLDAVDECHIDSRTMFLEHLSSLVNDKHTQTLASPRTLTKMMVTSRNNEQILDALSPSTNVQINIGDSAADMKSFIQASVERFSTLKHLDAATSGEIRHFLEAKAEGMFLWVALILTELERRDQRLTKETIRSRLSSIPFTLASIYAGILNDAPHSRRDDLWRILRWLAFGKRFLRVSELEAALCEETNVTKWYDFQGDISYLCRSLVRINDNEEVQFVHETAREFILNHVRKDHGQDTSGINMDPHQADADIATTSIRFMLREDCMENFRAVTRLRYVPEIHQYLARIDELLRRNPFFGYAAQQWAAHLQTSNPPEALLQDLTFDFLSSAVRRDAIMRLMFYFNDSGSPLAPVRVSPLHMAAYFNLPWLVDRYLNQGISPNLVGCMGDTALIWAAEMGSLEPVKTLLRAGSDPNKAEVDGWTALHWAARNGHVRIAELLLESGAKIDAQDHNLSRPIDWAIGRGHCGVAAVLQRRSTASEVGVLPVPPVDPRAYEHGPFGSFP